MLVFKALRDLTATLYNVDAACSYYACKCSRVITHTITNIYNNISCNIVYLQLDIECRIIVYIAAALRMACCNVLRRCLFIHQVNYK